jgi:hypothetical protein
MRRCRTHADFTDAKGTFADRDRAEIVYAWSNPVTNLGEHKHAYLRKVNQMIVGVGYYAP